jgi:hypothetical protein
MNERILKLFTQACYHGDYEPENVPNAVVEKFAELIVRKCAEVVTGAVDHREPASTYADKIKKHFGVEE